MTQVGKFIKVEVRSGDVTVDEPKKRAVCLGVSVSIFYWQRLVSRQSIHYLGQVFLGSRISCLLFLIWQRVCCHDTCHLGPAWSNPVSWGVLPGQASDLPVAGHELLFFFSKILFLFIYLWETQREAKLPHSDHLTNICSSVQWFLVKQHQWSHLPQQLRVVATMMCGSWTDQICTLQIKVVTNQWQFWVLIFMQ